MASRATHGPLVVVLSVALLSLATSAGAVDPSRQTGGVPEKKTPEKKQGSTSGAPPASASGDQSNLKVTGIVGVVSGLGKASLYSAEPVRVQVEGLPDWIKNNSMDVSSFRLYLDGRVV